VGLWEGGLGKSLTKGEPRSGILQGKGKMEEGKREK